MNVVGSCPYLSAVLTHGADFMYRFLKRSSWPCHLPSYSWKHIRIKLKERAWDRHTFEMQ